MIEVSSGGEPDLEAMGRLLHSLNDQGDLQCHGQVGEVSCAFSLVTCPVYLSPAATGTKPIRLHQVWQPAPVEVNEDALPDRSAGQQG